MANHLYDNLIALQPDPNSCFLQSNNNEEISFSDFSVMAARIAGVLARAGLNPGDRVVVQAHKSVEMVALYIATIQAGGVFLPLNTAYKRDEVDYFVQDSDPRIIVCDSGATDNLTDIANGVGATILTLNADGSGTLTENLDQMPGSFKTVSRGPNDLAAFLYTSGTTGRSKGAMLTHDNLLSNAKSLVDHWRITRKDTLIHALPIFHIHGLFVALNTSLLAGAKVRFMPAFDLEKILAEIPESTMLMGVPTFYTRLLSDPRLNRDLVGGMRLFVSGSAPLLAETHQEFYHRTGHRILERYGMTETNMITSNPYEGERRAGTVGMPLPGVEILLSDPDTGNPIAHNGIGMIEVRGPNVFTGYWKQPEKTAAELRENGFFITGDLGQISDDGYLSIVGRVKDLIITGGYNVYPKEIEEILDDIEGVSESAVFGVPDSDFGESIIAAIVPSGDSIPDAELLSEIVRDKLARFKHPRRYEFLDELPRNAMGKVQKNLLRQAYEK